MDDMDGIFLDPALPGVDPRAANSHLATAEWHRITVHHRAAVHGHEEVPRINRLAAKDLMLWGGW